MNKRRDNGCTERAEIGMRIVDICEKQEELSRNSMEDTVSEVVSVLMHAVERENSVEVASAVIANAVGIYMLDRSNAAGFDSDEISVEISAEGGFEKIDVRNGSSVVTKSDGIKMK